MSQELFKAINKVQAALTPAELSAYNPFLKNRYADLGSVWETTGLRQLLAEHGLAVIQQPYTDYTPDGRTMIGVVTWIVHVSGEEIHNAYAIPLGEESGKSVAQVTGSIITYLRRYALAAAFGIVADEDSDGNEPPAPKRQPPAPKRQAKKQPAPPPPPAPEQQKNGGPATKPRTPEQEVVTAGQPENPLLDAAVKSLTGEDDKKGYWDSLSPIERGVYRSWDNLIPVIMDRSKRYDNKFATDATILKLFPSLNDTGLPKAKTEADGRTRVQILRVVVAYATLRNAGMTQGKALAQAFESAENVVVS